MSRPDPGGTRLAASHGAMGHRNRGLNPGAGSFRREGNTAPPGGLQFIASRKRVFAVGFPVYSNEVTMAFPHNLVVRGSWIVSAVVAVILLGRGFQGDDDVVVVTSGQATARTLDGDRSGRSTRDRLDSHDIIVSLAMVEDDENRSEGFTLKRPMDVRVYAVGEGTGNEMHDFGVILDATTRRPVWEMKMRATHHAGGAEKNRMVDEVLSLPAGDYMVYYITDDSHSYGDWNSAAPTHPELWGITVLSAHGSVDRDVARPYDDRGSDAVLARIVQVGDDEHRRERFGLKRHATVRVYALGEGDGEMYDFASIEDAQTGHTLWEMTYRETEHAGGGSKNRVFDGTIHLPAGEYILVYRSDGSHSFGDWNVGAPDDRFNYGVTIIRQ